MAKSAKMIITYTLYLASFILVYTQSPDQQPLVTLPNGSQLRGVYQRSLSGRQVSTFGSVPYGSAKRFATPLAVGKWEGVLDAKEPSPLCLQYNYILSPKSPVVGKEDCLTVDVATPAADCSKLLPVVVLFPVGGWALFGAATYGPLYLLDNNVVHVAINSRVGILGYLSFNDSVIPGNWGLKDQSLALKWVKTNIKAFCGDPSSVTVIGDSTGASSSMFHSYSPMSRGLTHRFVSMSGSANNHFAIAPAPRLKAQRLGVLLHCPNPNNSSALLSCLRSKDASTIVAQFEQFSSYDSSPFGPVVEPPSDDAFLTVDPIKLLKLGSFEQKPAMFSNVQGEGLVPGAVYLSNQERVKKLNDNWLTDAPLVFDYNYTVSDKNRDKVSNLIRSHYFGNKTLDEKTLPILIDIFRDRGILADLSFTSSLFALHNREPTYYFLFKYFGSTSGSLFLGATLDQMRPYGPAHDDDLGYIYNMTYSYQAISKEDVAVTKAMCSMIAHFALTGKGVFGPNVEWRPIDKQSQSTKSLDVLEINSSSDYKMVSKYNLGDFTFWNSLPLNEPATIRLLNQ